MVVRCRERRRLRQQQGLEAEENAVADSALVARCALRPGSAGDAACDRAADGYAIRGGPPCCCCTALWLLHAG
jgi:hypothetical protein